MYVTLPFQNVVLCSHLFFRPQMGENEFIHIYTNYTHRLINECTFSLKQIRFYFSFIFIKYIAI